jgi:hypothetical protein
VLNHCAEGEITETPNRAARSKQKVSDENLLCCAATPLNVQNLNRRGIQFVKNFLGSRLRDMASCGF